MPPRARSGSMHSVHWEDGIKGNETQDDEKAVALKKRIQREREFNRHGKELERLTETMGEKSDFEEEESRHQEVLARIEEGLEESELDEGELVESPESPAGKEPVKRKRKAPVRPTARGAAGSPPPFKSPLSGSHESYAAFLKGTFIPGTSRRVLEIRRPVDRPSTPVCSSRLYSEPQYPTSEERRFDLLQTARRLRREIAQAETGNAKKLTPDDVAKMTNKLHDSDLSRRREWAKRELEKLDEPQGKERGKLSKATLLEMNQRLHDEWLKRRKRADQELRKEVEDSLWRLPTGTGEKVEEIVQRNYYGPMAKIRESAAAEKEKRKKPLYVQLAEAEQELGGIRSRSVSPSGPVSPTPKKGGKDGKGKEAAKPTPVQLAAQKHKKLGKAQVDASADRLCSTEQRERAKRHAALMEKYLSR
eukprot:Hpha_TRINITY_DN9304_c0_g1::TRINITY_DN9304_c0_g1_i2::g.26103::m.26103